MDNDNDIIQIPYIVHEGSVARMERTIKRLWVLCIVIFLALVLTNAGWIIYESSFEDIIITQEGRANNGSDLSLNGVGSGMVLYHGSDSETNDQSAAQENGR